MTKIWTIIGAVAIISLILFFIYKEGESKGSSTEIVKKQVQQIEIQNEIIEENKQVFTRKIINKSFTAGDNLQWLQDNICQDCKSR